MKFQSSEIDRSTQVLANKTMVAKRGPTFFIIKRLIKSKLVDRVDVYTQDEYGYDEFEFKQCDTIKFIFSTFSDDSYRYYNSLSEQRVSGELDIFGGEVVPVFTNINNGLGILLSKNAQEFNIKP